MTNGINWIGIDDSADKWVIAHYHGASVVAAREFELLPSESGYRKLIGWIKQLQGETRVVGFIWAIGQQFDLNERKSIS